MVRRGEGECVSGIGNSMCREHRVWKIHGLYDGWMNGQPQLKLQNQESVPPYHTI